MSFELCLLIDLEHGGAIHINRTDIVGNDIDSYVLLRYLRFILERVPLSVDKLVLLKLVSIILEPKVSLEFIVVG